MRKKDYQFWESAKLNNMTYTHYYDRLMELSVSMFDWQNLPDSVDPRYLELALFADGKAVFFVDEALGYLALRTTYSGEMDVYRIPIRRRALAANGYNKDLDKDNSVIIFNNLLHTNSMNSIEMYARRLYDLDRTIDINAKAQKTPLFLQCDEKQRLTLHNIYMKYDGNEPVIMGDNKLNPNAISVINTQAPYVGDRLYELKTQIWNEALTYLGISNNNVVKKERLITDEVSRNNSGTVASRYSRLSARQEACKQINKMFGLNIWCEFRGDDVIETETKSETKDGDSDE